jgi:hypothetical protein
VLRAADNYLTLRAQRHHESGGGDRDLVGTQRTLPEQLQRYALALQLPVDHIAMRLDPLRRRRRRSRRQNAPLKLVLFQWLGRSPIEACRGGELQVLRNRREADAERALYLSVVRLHAYFRRRTSLILPMVVR